MDMINKSLIEALGSENVARRHFAIGVLQSGERSTVIPLLVDVLAGNSNDSVRAHAAQVLVDFDHDDSIAALVRAMENDPSPRVREAAAVSIGGMAGVEPFRRASQDMLRSGERALIHMLGESESLLRRAAARSLGRLGSGAAADPLSEVILRADLDVLGTAAKALMSLPPQEAIPAITRVLIQGSAQVRISTATAIRDNLRQYQVDERIAQVGWFQPLRVRGGVGFDYEIRPVVEALATLAKDGEASVRAAVRAALKEIARTLARKRMKASVDVVDDDDGGPPTPTPTALEDETIARDAAAEENQDEFDRRYSDITLFEDDQQSLVPAADALSSSKSYWLQVAIRVKPSGIPSMETRQPLREHKQATDVQLYVAAEADGFKIDEPVDTLVLPPQGNSTKQAWFRVTPLQTKAGAVARIRLRVFYEFNLLEEIVFQAPVCDDIGRWSKDSPRLGFYQRHLELEYVDIHDVAPREMHIGLERDGDFFLFRFTFFNEERGKIEFAAPVALSASDLEDLLVGARRIWLRLALGEAYSTRLEAENEDFTRMVRLLATLGRNLWTRLFSFKTASALARVGKWLEAHPLSDGALIHVSVDRDASQFVFPWALLYDRPLPKENWKLPDPEGFWGMRYIVEQRSTELPRGSDEPDLRTALRIGNFQWKGFRNATLENDMMARFREQGQGALVVDLPPILRAERAYDLLLNERPDVLYFFTHGHTRQRLADLQSDSGKDLFQEFFDALPPDSPLRETYAKFEASLKAGDVDGDRSWIELSYGKLYLDDLYERIAELQSKPVVFLNMCESAQITPSLTDSLIHFFLDRNAKTVIGTECPMTVEFAHPFAEKLLTDVLAGESVGKSLLNSRRHFMERQNPLGLAYTLFGLATTSYKLSTPKESQP